MYAEQTGYYRDASGNVAWLGSAEYNGRKAHDECLPSEYFETRQDSYGTYRQQISPWCWLGRGACGFIAVRCAFCGRALGETLN